MSIKLVRTGYDRDTEKFFLIGEDGYSTSVEEFVSEDAAQNAADEENALLDAGKTSEREWKY